MVNRLTLIAPARGRVRHDRAEELLARLNKVGIPAGEVRTIDNVYAWDQTASQGLLIDVEHQTLDAAAAPRVVERGHPDVAGLAGRARRP